MTKYKVTFKEVGQIRMASKYNGAKVILTGTFIPDLSDIVFQDKFLISDIDNLCYLIQWNSVKNEAGFRVWKIDGDLKKVIKSPRVEGCCENIFFKDGEVHCQVWKWGGWPLKQ